MARYPHHFAATPNVSELIDGLLLGGACFRLAQHARTPRLEVRQPVRFREWVTRLQAELLRAQIETTVQLTATHSIELQSRAYAELCAFHTRWYQPSTIKGRIWTKTIPRDLRMTPRLLALWFAGAGSLTSNRYSVRFATHTYSRDDVEFAAALLTSTFGWKPDVFLDRGYPVLRIARSGDRLALRQVVAPWMPPCFAYRLNVKASEPCTEDEAARRRRPRRLTREDVDLIRQRVSEGESYSAIGEEYGVTQRHISAIARGDVWRTEASVPVRRRGPVRRLSAAEVQEILTRLHAGESQRTIARAIGVGQSRIYNIKKRYKPAV